MQVPLTVSFKDIPISEPLRAACWLEAQKLERYLERITSCHVTISRNLRRRKGGHFSLHVHVVVPGDEIAVSRASPDHTTFEDPKLTVRETFDEVRRQLQDYIRRLREARQRASGLSESTRNALEQASGRVSKDQSPD